MIQSCGPPVSIKIRRSAKLDSALHFLPGLTLDVIYRGILLDNNSNSHKYNLCVLTSDINIKNSKFFLVKISIIKNYLFGFLIFLYFAVSIRASNIKNQLVSFKTVHFSFANIVMYGFFFSYSLCLSIFVIFLDVFNIAIL